MKRTTLAALTLLLVLPLATSAWSYHRKASTAGQMSASAEKFLESLSAEQRKTAQLDYDTPKRLDWHFIPKDSRKGLQIRDMESAQRKAADGLLRSALSQIGYDKATKIMELENLLAELQKGKSGPIRDPERYYFTVFGKPSGDAKWGLSIEGHHMSLNFVVEGDKVVSSTPTVFCTNPAIVMNQVIPSVEKGTRVIKEEETLAFELLGALEGEQRKTAVIAAEAPQEVRAAGEPQPPTNAPEGIAASKLNDSQKQILRKLIEAYAANLTDDVAKDRLEAIDEAGFDKIHFAWAGAEKPGVGHYYRVQGPTFLIEFVNVQPDAAGNPANHIHCLWRDMRGDFAIAIEKKS
jgi:hypothetical protein